MNSSQMNSPQATTHATAHRGNILLVDDTPNNLRLLSAMLTDQGYEVRRVVNGQMALKTAQANPPDLILLDIKMPDMNGYEVCQHLKSLPETQSIPVIFISALDEVLDKVKAFAVGGMDYITKPFSEEEVFARVENVLTIRQLQKQLQEHNERLKQESAERQQLEGKLFKSEAKYQSLFNNSIVGIFRIRSQDGLFLEANQRLAEMLGHASATEIVHHTYITRYCINTRVQEQMLVELQGNSEPVNHKTQFCRRDGSVFWGVLSAQANAEEGCTDGVLIELSP